MASQCQKPTGFLGRLVLRLMNWRHSNVTDWGLQQITVRENDTILDVGCGGGRTLTKLSSAAYKGIVHGIDHAKESVATARRTNQQLIAFGRVSVEQASVSRLPFEDNTFHLVTAVETHFWWQDLNAAMKEIFRVLKPGGRLLIIAEFYNGDKHAKYAEHISRMTNMHVMNVDDHQKMFLSSGFINVSVLENPAKGWICCVGTKP